MPPADAHSDVVAWWIEIGRAEGEGPISWLSLESWQRQIGIELDVWEVRTIRRMSECYLDQQVKARKPDCPAPWRTETAAETRSKVDRQFAAFVAALQARKKT